MKKILVLLVIGSLLMVAQAAPPTSLCEFIAWTMTSAGINFIVFGPVLSVLVEHWPAWGDIAHKKKRLVLFGFCLIVPVLGHAVGYLVCAMPVSFDTVYLVLVAGVSAFTGSQFMHIKDLPDGSR